MSVVAAHAVTAEAVLANGVAVPLTVLAGRVALDESWSPYVRCELTVRPTADPDVLDPRRGVRIRVWLGVRYGSSRPLADLSNTFSTLADLSAAFSTLADLSGSYGAGYNLDGVRVGSRRSFDLGLRDRTWNVAEGTLSLTAASDEAILQDRALVAGAPQLVTAGSTRDLCERVLARYGDVRRPGTDDAPLEPGASLWRPGTSAWDLLESVCSAAGLRLYCDEGRAWRLTQPLHRTGFDGLASLTATLVRAEETMALDESWADAVVCRYTWRDEAGVDQERYDAAGSAQARRCLTIDYQTPYPGAGAAQRILDGLQARGRVLRIDAISDYSVTPGQAVRADLPGSPAGVGLISGVEWRCGEDEMTVRTREVTDTALTSWLFTPPGLRWTDVDPGVTWPTFTNDLLEES